ncbi:TPA: DUF551 domain-containing protein [Escherichia coli]|nr:DUF551 domain-containing protein [Escherichia coli]EFN9123259.1 DUF551 domain-containing protein [Escherichia coli]EGI6764462.1 DUF551 domain-containing protein [Escherichia coli]EGZ6659794.1 DUF551 domain-containing protein [Escherichia coli]EIG7948474.1 DUF551 domain-containing protein [Escherichia coli]
MSAITKERIELFIKNPLDNGLTRGEQMELARIALASLEAEPVVWKVTFTQIDREYNTFTGMYSDKAEVERWLRLHKACNFRADITPLYTAKPVPVTPDGWISCSERMPAQDDWILIYSKHGEYMAGQVQGEYVELSDGTLSWLGNALFWMPLPETPQEVK